jgi:hypothetical protein
MSFRSRQNRSKNIFEYETKIKFQNFIIIIFIIDMRLYQSLKFNNVILIIIYVYIFI